MLFQAKVLLAPQMQPAVQLLQACAAWPLRVGLRCRLAGLKAHANLRAVPLLALLLVAVRQVLSVGLVMFLSGAIYRLGHVVLLVALLFLN